MKKWLLERFWTNLKLAQFVSFLKLPSQQSPAPWQQYTCVVCLYLDVQISIYLYKLSHIFSGNSSFMLLKILSKWKCSLSMERPGSRDIPHSREITSKRELIKPPHFTGFNTFVSKSEFSWTLSGSQQSSWSLMVLWLLSAAHQHKKPQLDNDVSSFSPGWEGID